LFTAVIAASNTRRLEKGKYMKLRDFRIGWRMLVQEPVYSAVVVLGLSVGFAACFLLLGFVRYSFTYDADVPACWGWGRRSRCRLRRWSTRATWPASSNVRQSKPGRCWRRCCWRRW
jgi:hypothetical protein